MAKIQSGGIDFLTPETQDMEIRRTFDEQAKIRQYTGLRVRTEIDPDSYQPSQLERHGPAEYMEEQAGVKGHPRFLNNQAADGRDGRLLIDVQYHPEASEKVQRARNELKRQHDLKMGLLKNKDFDMKPPGF
jgi:hypothetical protein